MKPKAKSKCFLLFSQKYRTPFLGNEAIVSTFCFNRGVIVVLR